MEDVRAANQHYSDSMVRLWSAGIVFLLVIIFLGLLGTFWFRIRQRSGKSPCARHAARLPPTFSAE